MVLGCQTLLPYKALAVPSCPPGLWTPRFAREAGHHVAGHSHPGEGEAQEEARQTWLW